MNIIAAILIAAQPAPAVAVMPQPDQSNLQPALRTVDVIVINQYCSETVSEDGKPRSSVVFYISFWSVHYLPTGSLVSIPLWEYRGWCRNTPLVQCDTGWSCRVNSNTIVAPQVLFVVTDYDFEYRNRDLSWDRSVTHR